MHGFLKEYLVLNLYIVPYKKKLLSLSQP